MDNLIAIDLGYGDIKVCYKNKLFKFPNAVSKKGITINRFESIAEKVNSNEYLFNDKKYIVGDKVNNAYETRDFELLYKHAPLLIYHALKLAGVDTTRKDLVLATGLSVLNINEVNRFCERIKKVYVNNESIEFAEIKIRPQGRGIFDSYNKDKNGLVYVIDIGFNTLDILPYKDGVGLSDGCFANTKGANIIINQLVNILSNNFPKIDFTEQKAKEIFINGYIEIAGEKIDFQNEIQELKSDYTEYLINMLYTKNAILYEANKVIFSGGGAYFLDKLLVKNLVKTADFSDIPYEFANVRGYYEYYKNTYTSKATK
ncbi:ParM/StbA family protein [Campylobacter sp. MG1]|uniref:ParM/StbA family protein n=1 Tax=Campylobacter sp. MG1 TaxID=2976332 RepID=UPI00226D349D|nr:ParM/StbA family protein [Campylobacter sp. MG1]